MAAPRYELLEHPADIGFRTFGDSLAELYANSALAMLSIASEPAEVEPRERYALSVSSGDRESLLVDWLSEVLYWFDGKRIAFREFNVTVLTETHIDAAGLGEPRDPRRHSSHLVVKAVTYHQLKIEQRGRLWTAEVYLDI
jgi:SHS2 domain-containing protein